MTEENGTKERDKLLDIAIRKLEKELKVANLVTRATDKKIIRWPSLSTGSLGLDISLGIGGYPYGRITEIFGGEASGKTTLALLAIANHQRLNQHNKALFMDAEQAIDLAYAEKLGVDLERLFICQPDNGSIGFDVLKELLTTGVIGCAVVDSVSAMLPASVLNGSPSDITMGAHARLMSQSIPHLIAPVRKNNVALIMLNQIRMKLGVMFGNPETTSGGGALGFYASCRVRVSRILSKAIKDAEEDHIGSHVSATVKKNKMAPPEKKCEFDIMFGEGINRAGEVLDLAEQYGLIDKSGSWYSYNTERVGQGKTAATEFIKNNQQLAEQLEEQIKQRIWGNAEYVEPIEDDEEEGNGTVSEQDITEGMFSNGQEE
jgi:recombination protein RecA